ncbi:amino acid ABC transporter [Paraburkholderia caffeinilytica]|uniref:Amino acid ABC transporter n=1 Tax=Paraburkholderia caffeinilytica TaxID=1761016 RepID=A0ABQ1NBZ3_9BURK|nr:ABC transporter substrate-binding protein [Paraburkholderia caffeinilytica]AXL50359.1 amino acid ABC transporter [Paraburkholderia caffeinilytica]GGC67618.1 amino acid ABC transporter [Paraburkholderia caffeinilytica]CAB3804308.1 L-cystine-binding protein FliY [Paraburkholderia caffeinilytica]
MSFRSLARPFLLSGALALAAALTAQPAAAACTSSIPADALIKKGTLIMSTNPTLPPLQYTDGSGQLKGMRIELGDEVAKRLCLTPEYVKIDFDAMVPGLQSGRWDVINTGIFVTDARTRIMQMIPYENQAISISATSSNPLKITKTDDLAGHTVGVEIGGFEEAQARAMMKDMTARGLTPFTLRTFDTFSIAYQALGAGQVEAVVSIDAVAGEYQKRGGFARVVSGIHPTPVALAAKNPALASAIAGVLDEMQKDGSYQKLFAKYGIKPLDAPIAVAQPK